MTVYFGHVWILSMLRDRPEFVGMRGMLLLLLEVTVLAYPCLVRGHSGRGSGLRTAPAGKGCCIIKKALAASAAGRFFILG